MDRTVLSPRAIYQDYLTEIDGLDSRVRVLLLAVLINAIGTGFILPFITIYMHEVIGLSYSLIGLALAIRAAVNLGFKLFAGYLVDNVGRRKTMIAAGLLFISGYIAYLQAADFTGLLIAVLLEGTGIGLFWPSSLAAISDLVDPAKKRIAYAINRASRTAGLGLGLALGSIVAVFTYRGLFYMDILFTAFFVLMIYRRVPETRPDATQEQDSGSLSRALRDPQLLGFTVIATVFALLFAQLLQILPPYLKDFLSVPKLFIGNIFLINALIVVAFQLRVARRVEELDAMDSVRNSLILWIGASLLLWLAVPGVIAIVFALLALILIAGSEMVYNPVATAFVTDLAPDEAVGSYVSLYSVAYSLGFIIGPALGGWFLDSSHPHLLWLLLAGLTAGALGLLGFYRRHLL
ncbi:MAG: MFS transporter [Candidatus Nanohaloarchaea archaeon]|nr:MFS transporter [Candidatus Nanohaloarchaea archaeon]